MSKKTIIIGASTNPSRYSYIAAGMLKDYGHEFIPIGIKKGEVFGKPIQNLPEFPKVDQVDTITLYIGPQHQPPYYDYMLGLKPKRIIFNPGTENPDFYPLARAAGVETCEACTLVLLRTGQY